MYSVVVTVLLFFPWLLAIHIALGAFRAARRRAIFSKQTGQRGTIS